MTAHTAPDGTLRQFVQDAAGSHLQTQTRAVNESVGGWFREGQQRGVRYVFDRAGELRQRRDVRHNGEKEDFSWDDNRQLVAVRKGERLVRYGYDGLGRRVFKQTAEETRWFYWQGDALAGETVTITREPLAAQSIFDTGSRLQRQKAQAALFGSMREYVYYPGSFQPLALLTQEAGRKESWHYHCDPNGAPVRLTSLQGEIVWSEKTGVWGEKGEVYADRISNPLRFQGQYFDAETGLHYNRHRYYDPEIAGFISQDPIGLAGGLNVYQYAPNPLSWIDPLGLKCGFAEKDNITQRWVNKLTGKAPAEIDSLLTSKGWTKIYPQAGRPEAIQHIQYVKTTKSGTTYKLDYHPGGNAKQQNIHGNDYWKVYRTNSEGEDIVYGRIGHGGFEN